MTRESLRGRRSTDRSLPERGLALVAALVVLTLVGSACGVAATGEPLEVSGETTVAEPPASDVVERAVRIVATHPHDTVLFTQGLEFDGDLLVESGGKRGESRLRVYNPDSGEVVADRPMSDELFAEGSTVVGDTVWQLTWTAERGFVYGLENLDPIAEFEYDGEGWGLCSFDDRFVMSNGSDELTFRSLDDFSVEGSVSVRLDGQPIDKLNELECVSDLSGSGPGERIWANVYRSNMIYGIDPATGSVTDIVDLTDLVPPGFEGDTDQVLNGIARHPTTGRFWFTGKRWPVLYEAEFVEGEANG